MRWILAAAWAAGAGLALAGPAEVVDAHAVDTGPGWRVTIVVLHTDTGWGDFVDGWRIAGPDGSLYAQQTIRHPRRDAGRVTHMIEDVRIPESVAVVVIGAHTSDHGWGADFPLTLPR